MQYDDQLNNPYAYFEETLDFQGHVRVSELGDENDTEPRTPFVIECLWRKWPLPRTAKVIVTQDELTVEAKGLQEPVVISRKQAADVLEVKRECLKFSEFYYPLRKLKFDRRITGKKKEKQMLNIIRLTVWQEPKGTPEEMYKRVYERISKHSFRIAGFYLYALLGVFSVFLYYLLVFRTARLHFLLNPDLWGFTIVAVLLGIFSCVFLLWGKSQASMKMIGPALLGLFGCIVFLVLTYESLVSLGFFYFYSLFFAIATIIEFLLLPNKIRRLEKRFLLENDIGHSQEEKNEPSTDTIYY